MAELVIKPRSISLQSSTSLPFHVTWNILTIFVLRYGIYNSHNWRGKWQLAQVFLPEKSYGQRSLAGNRLWGRKDLDMTEASEHAHMHTCILPGLILKIET